MYLCNAGYCCLYNYILFSAFEQAAVRFNFEYQVFLLIKKTLLLGSSVDEKAAVCCEK